MEKKLSRIATLIVWLSMLLFGGYRLYSHRHAFLALLWIILIGILAFISFIESDNNPSNYQSANRNASSDDQRIVDPPAPETTDDSYGLTNSALSYRLHRCMATVKGIPGSGLTDSGFSKAQVLSGKRGEQSVAKALLYYGLLDTPNARVWFSLRNPSDASGNADIDIVYAIGKRVWLIDAKHSAPARPGDTLIGPSDNKTTPRILRMRGSGKEYRATANMSLARDAIKQKLLHAPAITDTVVLLTRTANGVPGIENNTRWPGEILARNIDQWMIETRKVIGDLGPVPREVVSELDSLVKDQDWVQRRTEKDYASRKFAAYNPNAPISIQSVEKPISDAIFIGNRREFNAINRIFSKYSWQKPISTISGYWDADTGNANIGLIAVSAELYETAKQQRDQKLVDEYLEFLILGSQSACTVIVSNENSSRMNIDKDLRTYAQTHGETYKPCEWIDPNWVLRYVVGPELRKLRIGKLGDLREAAEI